MTRRPPEAECRDETTCLRPNVLTGHTVSPDPTRQKARHSKWNQVVVVEGREVEVGWLVWLVVVVAVVVVGC